MTTDDEAALVVLVAELHRVCRIINEHTPENRRLTAIFQAYLNTLPEGEREVWNMEADPPIGVGLREGRGNRWLEVTALDDETIVWAARKGLLGFGNGGTQLFDALKNVPDRDTQHFMAKIIPHVHSGGSVSVELLK